MSDTPRTDAIESREKEVHAAFSEMRSHAWQLERELAATRELNSMMRENMRKMKEKYGLGERNVMRELRKGLTEARRELAETRDQITTAEASAERWAQRCIEARGQRDRLADALREMLRRSYNEMELRKIAKAALESLE
jgi:hypothetical protein